MKAVICTKYGGTEVLKLKDIVKPKPKENQILIKTHATTVSSGDARLRRADPFLIRFIFGFKRPRKSILGVVIAGEIESVGDAVTKFKVGDQVFGTTGMAFGAHAQYACVSEEATLAIKPLNMSYEEAAAIPFGATAAIHFLRKANIKMGQKVLIYGASGAIGSIAVQLAKGLGAEVTAVCSGANHEMVKVLGADKVIDYTKEDFTKGTERYDVIFETVGKSKLSTNLSALTKKGSLLMASASVGLMLRGGISSLFGSKKVLSGMIKETAADMNYFKELIEANRLKAVIDSIYPLEKIAAAHAKVDTGHKKGNIIVNRIN